MLSMLHDDDRIEETNEILGTDDPACNDYKNAPVQHASNSAALMTGLRETILKIFNKSGLPL